MVTFFKTVFILACMVSIIPAVVWFSTGRFDRAAEALKDYLKIMGCIVVPGLVVAGLALLSRLF